MDWKDVGSAVVKAAPLIGSILTGNVPGAVASAGTLLASVFGTEATPDALHAAIATDPQAAEKLAEAELTNKLELQKLSVTSAANEIAADTARLAEVNATMRAEAAANDAWVRRWRPFWGYVSAVTFSVVAVLVLVLLALAIFWHDADAMAAIPSVISQFVLLFGVPGAILGIASWHRGMMQREQAKAGDVGDGG